MNYLRTTLKITMNFHTQVELYNHYNVQNGSIDPKTPM